MDAANSKPEAEGEDIEQDEISAQRYERFRALRDDPGREARWAKWREENAQAIEASNAYVEKHGLPLAKYRLF